MEYGLILLSNDHVLTLNDSNQVKGLGVNWNSVRELWKGLKRFSGYGRKTTRGIRGTGLDNSKDSNEINHNLIKNVSNPRSPQISGTYGFTMIETLVAGVILLWFWLCFKDLNPIDHKWRNRVERIVSKQQS